MKIAQLEEGERSEKMDKFESAIRTIEPAHGWRFINLKELLDYFDLLFFLVWRDIRVQYAQTVLGFLWAIIQPAVQIILFTVVFGSIAKISTDGIPYVLFTSIGTIPWNYISTAMVASGNSLVMNQYMLSKVYFPRIIYPLAPVLVSLLDFVISLIIIIAVLVYYKVTLTINIVYFPLVFLIMVVFTSGVGIWFSSVAVRFRDLKIGMPFFIRMLMYTAPVVYPISSIPKEYLFLYSLNPTVAVVEGFRSCLIGPVFNWSVFFPGACIAILIFVSGVFYFKRVEHTFVDIV
jgi:lipopolysaccharide transport system permease protein